MKRLVFMAALLSIATMVWGATKDMDNVYATAINASITIDSQHTDYGDWERVCSVAAIEPVLDSGFFILQVTGTVTLPRGGALYVGIDSAAGTTDTLYGYTKVEVPNSSRTNYTEIPFAYTWRTAVVDSTDDDSLPQFVVTMATAGLGHHYAVKHVVLQQLFDYLGD